MRYFIYNALFYVFYYKNLRYSHLWFKSVHDTDAVYNCCILRKCVCNTDTIHNYCVGQSTLQTLF